MRRISVILFVHSCCTVALAAPAVETPAIEAPTTTTAPAPTAPAAAATTAPAAGGEFVDDGSPLLGLFALVVVLILVGVGIVVGLFGLGILALIVFAGIVSSSVVIGAAKKRTSAGFRALFLQLGGVGGLLAGSAVFWAIGRLLDAPLSGVMLAAIGGGLGLAMGLLAGWAFNVAWTWVVNKLTTKPVPP